METEACPIEAAMADDEYVVTAGRICYDCGGVGHEARHHHVPVRDDEPATQPEAEKVNDDMQEPEHVNDDEDVFEPNDDLMIAEWYDPFSEYFDRVDPSCSDLGVVTYEVFMEHWVEKREYSVHNALHYWFTSMAITDEYAEQIPEF